MAASAIAGGAWWLLDATVPAGDSDDVVAQLDATEEALARAQDALAVEQSSTAELRGRVFDLRAQVDEAEQAALLLAYFAGLEKPDTVTGQLWDRSWGGVVSRDTAVERIGDPALTELYWGHIGGGYGEPVPGVADSELIVRLIELTIEPILEAG